MTLKVNPTNKPKLTINSDLTIGYKNSIAAVSEDGDIELGGGTHYLIARNGRGKTTLLRTLAGVLKPIKGSFFIHGKCQLVSEDLSFDKELTAKNILKSLLAKNKLGEAMELANTLELDLTKPYGKLSTGNKRKVALLAAEFSTGHEKGDVLLLDEPFTGLDTFAREVFQDLWSDSDDGVLRLVSCHPDFDSMQMNSSVLITDGHIKHLHGDDVPNQWGVLKNQLN
ncbi:MAG: ATP-binding cassette domain-containing protein [Akkermansiaceae bacterium]